MKNTPLPGCAGAILVHPILFFLAFAKGAIFSHQQPLVMSATSAHGASESGLAGGMNAVEEILIIYVMTLGIAPIIVSVAGAALAFLLTWFVSRMKSSRP